MKSSKYLIFLVFYLLVLILAGANRLGPYPLSGVPPKTVLSKAWVFIWSLMPSQTVGWWTISLVVLVILIVLVFVAGCKLISFVSRYKLIVFVSDKVRVHFMRKEKAQRSKVCKPEYCARCAKKMGEDPKVQSDRIMLYFSENHVEEYVCPICGDVIKKAILMEPAKLHRYLQEQDLEDIEHEPRFRPIS